GNEVIVVVSAMAGVTNKFVDCVNALGANEGHPEYDTVLSSGELITAGLTAIALENVGIKSRSYSSWQVPIYTDNNYGRAVIQNVDPSNLNHDLKNGIVPVVCGFQGVSQEGKITTLGRGGSDLTAVAIASATNADLCEIYSDVDGVYTVDPNLYSGACRIEEICYSEMLEMASQGAKVLQEQSVSYAMEKNVVIRVASSFINAPGTIISPTIAAKKYCGMAVAPELSPLQIVPKVDYQNIQKFLAKYFIQCDLINCKSKMQILVERKNASVALGLLKNSELVSEAKYKFSRKSLSRISVVGSSIDRKNSEQFSDVLKKNKIDLFASIPGRGKINLIIPRDKLLDAISVLHRYCGLDK
ncbi:MAG: aspartate kinase, partial [Alphaproteobacteria bacterium]|nr:aspartate kinase [Alphaproteobacteria bacterium]